MAPSTAHKSLILLSCTFLGLICGTLYLYSSYSPQLALKLHYSATDASSIALVGSFGVAVTGPIAGIIVDRKGYTVPLTIGGFFIMFGYYVLRSQFMNSYSSLSLSCSCLFLVGSGSTFINSVCLKCCAVTFPSLRGVATSLPLALYGLSAMFYSVLASMFYPGDTSGFLGFLIWSSAAIFAVCSPFIMVCDRSESWGNRTVRLADPIELATLRNSLPDQKTSKLGSLSQNPNELSGLRLLRSSQFWILFLITGATTSLGQMYIYSVGYMVKALVIRKYHLDPTVSATEMVDTLIQNQQQFQVGILSVANCVGRLVAGVMGDIITQNFRKPRAWLLYVPGIGLIFTQLLGQSIGGHEYLGVASLLSGFFYGYTFCIMPTIVGDTFGMENFSGNWGLVGLAPVIPSIYLTRFFGEVYDSKSTANEHGIFTCSMGSLCYSSVFEVSFVISMIACLFVIAFTSKDSIFKRYLRVDRKKVLL